MPAEGSVIDRGGWFPSTRWSVVRDTADAANEVLRRQALNEWCRLYWHPVRAFIRAHGHEADAEDLTQEFFARWLEKNLLHGLSPENGRLRAYLAVVLRRFLLNARERQGAAKRGGGWQRVDGDTADASQDAPLVSDGALPDAEFDRQWALGILQRVLERLKTEYDRTGKADVFAALRHGLAAGPGAVEAGAVAAELQMTEGAVRVAMHRLRRRFRELLVEEVAPTVSNDGAIEPEIRALLDAL